MDNDIQGVWECMRKLENMGGVEGTFIKKSLRKALRAAAKFLYEAIFSALPVGTGATKAADSYRATKRRKNFIGMTVGLYGSLLDMDHSRGAFYEGWVNFGHGPPKKKRVKNSLARQALAIANGQKAKAFRWVKVSAEEGARMGGEAVGKFWTRLTTGEFPKAQEIIVSTLRSELAAIAKEARK